MKSVITNFPNQFTYNPSIENKDGFRASGPFIVVGIGGSHLAADLVKTIRPDIQLSVHCDYGLPPLSDKDLKNSSIVLVSYSGNTEEVVEALNQCLKKKIKPLIISIGGKLGELATEYKLPFIKIPATGIQPRMAIGYSFKALLKAIGEENILKESTTLAKILKPRNLETAGKKIASLIKGRVPVVYGSNRNAAIVYNWKIKFNETGKIPAFSNVLPEMNHNEMTGFDVKSATKALSRLFHFIILVDDEDNERVLTRMEVLEQLYCDRKLAVSVIKFQGKSRLEKIFSMIILGDWAAFYSAVNYGVESEQVPMVEEFKRTITKLIS